MNSPVLLLNANYAPLNVCTTRRASAAGALLGAAAGSAALIYVTWFSPLHFYLYAVVGITTCVVVGYLASLVLPAAARDLTGLTRAARGRA